MTSAVIGVAVAIGLEVAAVEPPAAPASPRTRPDIVLVTIDALRADHVTSYGYARLTTPAIDAFMRRAVRWSHVIAQAPYTKASIASVMTGLYPSTHHAVTTSVPFAETMTGHLTTAPIATDLLSASTPTLATLLHAAGYRTVAFTANPFLTRDFGFAQGFDLFQFYPGPDFAGADRLVADAIEAARTTQVARPLFLWVHLMEPHSPYTPPPLTDHMFKLTGRPEPIGDGVAIPSWLMPGTPRDRRVYVTAYDEKIAAADAAFDALIRELRSVRQDRDTVVAVTADHGEQFLDHGGWEHSSNLFDELIRVPLGLAVPGVPPGLVDTQVRLVDLFPTLLELADADIPANAGETLADTWRGHGRSRLAMSEIVGSAYALRDERFKLIESSDGREQLFNLALDPAEQNDVAAASGALVSTLRGELHDALARALEAGRSIHRTANPVDPALVERLRALGYTHP